MKRVLAELKPVYTATPGPLALEALEGFEAIWGSKYPLIVNSWRTNWAELSTFFKYPPKIRKIIYTANMIEKGYKHFPNDESLQKMLYLATMYVLRK